MIWRLAFFFVFAVVAESFFSAFSLVLGFRSFPLVIIPIVVVYGAFFQLPLEAILTAVVVGLVVDCLTGSPIGLNVFAQIVLWLTCGLLAVWIGKPRWVIVFGFIVFASLMYGIILHFIVWGVGAPPINFEPFDVLLVPLLNGVIGYFLLKKVITVFTKSELGEQSLINSEHVKIK